MMSFDGIVTRAVVEELKSKLMGGRITKIYQPSDTDVLFTVRAQRENITLLFSVHPSYARFHTTTEKRTNPKEPPMFCMVLRKHLEGSIIEDIEQLGLERVVTLKARGKTEIGDTSFKELTFELMGKHSNLLLVDSSTKTIVDSIKHLGPSVNRHRTVLPGRPYVQPPGKGKHNPLEASEMDVLRTLDFNAGKLSGQLVNAFEGVSPLLAESIVKSAGIGQKDGLITAFLQTMKTIRSNTFDFLHYKESKPFFYVLPLPQFTGETIHFQSASAMLDGFFTGKAERDRVRQQSHDISRLLSNEMKKNEKKIKKLQLTEKDAEKADSYKKKGELLTAHMHLIKPGDKTVDVLDYYEESQPTLTITLDPHKSAAENAQKSFQKYTKLKKAKTFVHEQIKETEEENVYLDTLVSQLLTAGTEDIGEIREELIQEGFLKQRKAPAKKKAKDKPTLSQFESSDGFPIYVGKNNTQNEYLTNRFAHKSDMWFHTKDIPGSHVVIRSDEPSEQAIREAAMIAAFYSKAGQSSSVPVDYTQIRHVRKPRGAKPGFVIYDEQQTVYVTPDEEAVLGLRR
ncbi:putative ribosome quality control (RQC) complex YloA/Tae2 family protein [Aureibacillus halotolerans]|uniref:Rqc2 homolog RqcH n=2 Tax=Aureibacillus halotolerans TaxID=1508390 RepID=A0A4R6U7M3_9BACI|nr:putative ribosome quality control (RQC) complex YloA/Tae2 family protein [Aureibacillus halotolerans]